MEDNPVMKCQPIQKSSEETDIYIFLNLINNFSINIISVVMRMN